MRDTPFRASDHFCLISKNSSRTVGVTERTRHAGRTDRVKPIYPIPLPQQFLCAWCIMILHIFDNGKIRSRKNSKRCQMRLEDMFPPVDLSSGSYIQCRFKYTSNYGCILTSNRLPDYLSQFMGLVFGYALFWCWTSFYFFLSNITINTLFHHGDY